MTKVTVETLSEEAGRALFERAERRLGRRIAAGDHEAMVELEMLAPFASRRVPWPEGSFERSQLRRVAVGMFLAPVAWETKFLRGSKILPWVEVVRRPITHRVMGPGEHEWRWETRISCRVPTGEVMYYIGEPRSLVRVIVPPEETSADDE